MHQLTQFDVAQRAGVSQKAVSFALSNDPELNTKLRPETRHRILQTARQMGYVPHHAARRLARARSSTRGSSFDQVGLISFVTTDDDVESVCLAMMAGAERELSKLHASLTFLRVGERGDWTKVERLARAGGVDGWLLYGDVNDEVVNRLKLFKLPCVILGDHRCKQSAHSVNIDNFAVGRMAVEHLASLGHRRIGYMGGGSQHLYQEQTLHGFLAARNDFGLDRDDQLITDHSFWGAPPEELIFEAHPERVMEWLRKSGAKPTALFSPELIWAPEICRVLKSAGMDVPKDVSILACQPASGMARSQKFSRIELPMAEVGRQGAMLLHRIVSGERVDSSELKISPSLVEGWSTCPLRIQHMLEEKTDSRRPIAE